MGLQRDPPKAASSNGHLVAAKKDARAAAVRYMECRKNHAASIGGYAVDGCREFMPSGQEGTGDALRCAACSCHRSFHRRQLVAQPPDPPPAAFSSSACSGRGGGCSSSNSSSRR